MEFLDRKEEMMRLESLRQRGGLGVVWGRRRIGKTRLLIEWQRKSNGLYLMASRSKSAVQRKYLADAAASVLSGFSDVEYPDWRVFLTRLSSAVMQLKWNCPIIIDEFPYLVNESPDLPSLIQEWIDHLPKNICVVLAGSNQRMMQGLVLDSDDPLYGRAKEMLHLQPLPVKTMVTLLPEACPYRLLSRYAVFGGIPRYWELAEDFSFPFEEIIDHIALNPMGILHNEPERLLLEEDPPALAVRPILDAIGMGAHRLSEIAGRIGVSATSLGKPLRRLIDMGVVRREIPFGESEKKSKRSLFKIEDPFFRFWFMVIASNSSLMNQAPASVRKSLWHKYRIALESQCWEDLCRSWVSRGGASTDAAKELLDKGPWVPAGRWWHGNQPEWDIVSTSIDNNRVLLGEVKLFQKAATEDELKKTATSLLRKGCPENFQGKEIIHALFVPQIGKANSKTVRGVLIIQGNDILDI